MTFAASTLTPSAHQGDVVIRFLSLLVDLGIAAGLLLLSIWLGRVMWREDLIRRLAKEHPEEVRVSKKAMRSVPLLRTLPVPADPYALTHRVVVAPVGDGRPGEAFWAPGPHRAPGPLAADGSRTDATVVLAEGVHLLVVCFGRIGSTWGGRTVERAAERVEGARAGYTPAQTALGPVDRLETAAGTGWRTTYTFGVGQALTDTHVDHAGWAFAIGVLSQSWHARAVDAADRILATWRWIPADEASRSGASGGFPSDAWMGPSGTGSVPD